MTETQKRQRQRFIRGDRVRVAADLGPHMRHFANDQDAIILYSYHNMFGYESRDSWCIHLLKDGYSCSWYNTHQLTPIRGPHGAKLANRLDPPVGWQRLIAMRPWQD